MSFAKPIFTTRGKQIELQGIEGQQIIFTKIKIGDGRITTQSPSQLTDLINVIAEAPITSLKRYDAYAAIRSVFQNIDVPEAFWWREVGLFATDPATGEEVLYAYQNAYDTAEYITPSSLVTKKINWTIYIDDGENLGADIHKKMVFCSVEDLDEHNDLEGAHEPAFTAHNEDEGAHESRFSQYVKRSGDVMTAKRAMVRDVNNSNIFICGGKDEFSGAYLQAYGADEENFGGAFVLAANKDTNSSMLKGYPSGELTWGNTLKFSSKHGGYIHREAPTSMWFNGRDYAMLQQKSLPDEGYGALYSLKTNSGSWECGACNYNKDNLIFTFIDDKKYNLASAEEDSGVVPAENNVPKMQFLFGTDGSLKWRDSANGVEKFFVTGINGVNADINGNVDLTPAGTMQMFAGNTIPAGWLLCDGSAVSRTAYAKLFAAIGTIYGGGDGSTTFALPNLIDRFLQGSATAGTYKKAGLPDHYHLISRTADVSNEAAGTGVQNSYDAVMNFNTRVPNRNFKTGTVTQSESNSIYGASTTVQPPALTMLPIIKY